jgi:hypothetical protein
VYATIREMVAALPVVSSTIKLQATRAGRKSMDALGRQAIWFRSCFFSRLGASALDYVTKAELEELGIEAMGVRGRATGLMSKQP